MTLLKNSLFTLLVWCIASQASAFTLNGNLKGDKLRWRNAVTQGDYISTSYWQPLSNLTPTSAWLPGLFRGATPTSIVLNNASGESVTVALSVEGLEYNRGTSTSLFTAKPKPSWVGYGNCITQEMGSVIRLMKSGSGFCTSDTAFYSDTGSYTPFSFLRPIIKLPDLAAAFSSAGVGEGTYRGGVIVNGVYGYISPTGAVTYRNGAIPLDVSIQYSPAMLTSISVSGFGIIEPVYDKAALTVSGTTRYTITANGYFSNGLHMVFDNHSVTDDYQLEQVGGAATIPYSISCPECESPQVVNNGMLQNADNTVPGRNVTMLQFHFDVGYNDIPAASIESGTYTDVFTVMFEPNL
ncbi:hypothetical protein [Aeromonas enterica]